MNWKRTPSTKIVGVLIEDLKLYRALIKTKYAYIARNAKITTHSVNLENSSNLFAKFLISRKVSSLSGLLKPRTGLYPKSSLSVIKLIVYATNTISFWIISRNPEISTSKGTSIRAEGSIQTKQQPTIKITVYEQNFLFHTKLRMCDLFIFWKNICEFL